jgi:hypothetical protein
MITETEQFINWKNSKTTQSCFDKTWTSIDVPWEEVIQTKEVVDGDPWDIYTTDLKDELSELHASWNIPDESVKHYMSIRPKLKNGLENLLVPFQNYVYNYSLLKLTAGHMIVWHFDTYATFVKHNDIKQSDADKIKRTAIMLTDWNFGHVLQVGPEVFSNWEPGQAYTWNNDTWHGASNFGKDDMILMQVTYIEK